MTFRSGRRESHYAQRHPARVLSAIEPQVENAAKSSIELKRELMDKSCKSRLIGGTIVVYGNTSDMAEHYRDTIKWLEHDQRGLKITTYRGRSVNVSLMDADTELKEINGVIHIDRWPIERFTIAPKGVEIPSPGRS
jgi:hypothetical protein